jgi:hypothetical protein
MSKLLPVPTGPDEPTTAPASERYMVGSRCAGGGVPTIFKCGVSYGVATKPVIAHTVLHISV